VQLGAGARHHVRDAEGPADLHQLAARDQHLLAPRQRVEHQQHRGGIVVDDGRRLGAGEPADLRLDEIVAVAAPPIAEVEFEVWITVPVRLKTALSVGAKRAASRLDTASSRAASAASAAPSAPAAIIARASSSAARTAASAAVSP
jgi:hypothetical protein